MSLLLAYYGDDFTGSTDVMEALSIAGLRTVLFLEPPTPGQLAQFPGLRAFGIAGGSRTLSPEQMDRTLPPAFEALRASCAPIVHYKICSTFDSSPTLGSIGHAIELGRRVFVEQPTPLVVGAPPLGRYVVFGNLFARSGLDTDPFRLDRHPTMSRHPVTPMQEADLRLILATQTRLPVVLVDVLSLDQNHGTARVCRETDRPPIVLFDTLHMAHLATIGAELARTGHPGPRFTVGSSGVEYALVEHWRRSGTLPPAPLPTTAGTPAPVEPQMAVVSGSCSPVTDRQIANALRNPAFMEIPLQPLAGRDSGPTRLAVQTALQELASGRSPILHTSRGPDDPRTVSVTGAQDRTRIAAEIPELLGHLLETLLEKTRVRRAIVCGGDTSMLVARHLGIQALEYLGPAAPGSPRCRVHAPGRVADGCEMVFKGGQVGRDPFFTDMLNGGPTSPASPGPGPSGRASSTPGQNA